MRKGYESISDFIFMEDSLETAEVILIPGGSQRALIERAAELYHGGYGKYILPSGSYNNKIGKTEYDFLLQEGLKLGIPENAFIKEDKATHTFENAVLSYEALKEKDIKADKVILVCKNYHARRAYLTYRINFPKHIKIIVQPVIDSREITKTNWIEAYEKRQRVMSEVTKIGQYFDGHLEKLIEEA